MQGDGKEAEGKEEKLDPLAWDGMNMERKGDPRIGWPLVWDDKRDDSINTGLRLDALKIGDPVEVWFRGFWWQCTIIRKAKKTNTVTVRWNHSGLRTAGYRVTLVRLFR